MYGTDHHSRWHRGDENAEHGGPEGDVDRPRRPHRRGRFGPGGFGAGGFGPGDAPGFGPEGPRGGRRRGPFGPGGFGPGGFGPGPRRGRGGHGGHGHDGHGHGGRGRRSRGDVRTAVLALLAEEPMHGYQIIQEIGERSGGAWRPSPGSVYPTVSQLADEGLVRTEKSEGRSVVHLTEQGQTYVAEHREALDAVWRTAGAEDGFVALRTAGQGLMGAARQVAEVGSAEQVAETVRVLDEARRRLYLLLADEAGGATDGGPTDEPTDDTEG